MDSRNIRESDPMLVDKRNENAAAISTILSTEKCEKIESSNRDDVRGESSQSAWRYVPGQGFHRYKNALGNLAPFRRKKKGNQTKPVDGAGFFSFVVVTWVSKYMYRGYKKGFTPEDWPRLSPYDGSDSSADRLEKLWNDEVRRRGKEKASFGKVAWRFIRTRVIISNTLFACSTVCGFISQTLLMRKLLEHVESADDGYEEGIKWAILLILGEVLRLFLFAWTWAIAYRTAVRFKLACMVMLYRKIIRLNHLGNTGIGELVNLFSNDCQRVLDMVMYGPMVIGGPIMTICGVWYILKLLGPMALLGILVFVIFFPTQYSLSRLAGYLRGKTLKISDTRIRLTNEILDSIKLIKMYAWEKCFRENLLDIRKKEQRLVLGTNYCQSFSIALSPAVPIISAIITFLAHLSTGRNLTAAQAFPISTFFGSQMTQTLMRSKDGYQMLCESSVSFERLKKVLLIEDGSCRVSKPIVKSQAVAINHGTFAYGAFARRNDERIEKEEEEGKDVGGNSCERTRLKVVPEFERVEVLFDVTLEAKKGQLIGICGQVGSGKSSLLLAALGQLHTSEGQVMREGSCAYVSQQAWIVNETLRDNILFGESFDPKRYYRALQVCNLTYDLEMMPGGDRTEIGERGINLSGGQKQRVALARALYANRDIYFLDDPLSAVDAHVGSHIFDHLILGALREKTVLFVTHQIQYLNRCDDVYMMRDGRIVEHGTHDYLMKMNGEYALMVNAILAESAETTNTNDVDEDIVGQPSENNKGIGARTTSNRSRSVSASSRISTDNDENVDKANVALTEAEKSEEGVVKASTYMTYIAAAGGWFSTVLVFLLTVINVGSSSFSAWWLAKWLNAGGGNITDPITNTTTLSNNINDNPHFSTYQSVYAASIGLILGANLFRSFIYCKSTITASTNLHNRLFQKITSSTMRFFDTTPTGRIQNLFSRDVDEVDNRLPIAVDTIIQNLFLVFSAICLVCFVFPWLIIPMCGLGVMYYFFGQVYRIALRGLKRVESTSRSPILSCVMATVQGLSTIHAFDKAVDFKRNFSKLVDDNSGYLFMSLAATRWLAVRIDSLAILTISITAVLVVFTKGQVLPASAGLALTYSAYISGIFQYTIRVMSEAETQFISVERMNHYINLPEIEGDNGKAVVKIDASWPRAGVLKFVGVFMSYGKDKPLVLRDVTFAVNAREKIGIVGRTGSGKSSLTVALFRLVELAAGKIMIDDVDISEVGLEELRSRLSIIPQDPVLFSGTIRSNLDPFKKNSDSEIWEALDKTKLKDRVRSINGQLDASVGFGGDNLSVGERQLLCLARAVLRHAKILVLDEATAAVDPETEIAVQNTIQREFVDSTVLTIAHRLQTVVSCDRILVMDDGRVAEFDAPSTLLADERSQFFKMMEAAEKATRRS